MNGYSIKHFNILHFMIPTHIKKNPISWICRVAFSIKIVTDPPRMGTRSRINWYTLISPIINTAVLFVPLGHFICHLIIIDSELACTLPNCCWLKKQVFFLSSATSLAWLLVCFCNWVFNSFLISAALLSAACACDKYKFSVSSSCFWWI